MFNSLCFPCAGHGGTKKLVFLELMHGKIIFHEIKTAADIDQCFPLVLFLVDERFNLMNLILEGYKIFVLDTCAIFYGLMIYFCVCQAFVK